MQMLLRQLRTAAIAALVYSPAFTATIRVDNPAGNVAARVVKSSDIQIKRFCPTREIRKDDVTLTRQPDLIDIKAHPSDNAQVDLEIEIPYGFELQAQTRNGAISVSGLIYHAELTTETGDIKLAVPWNATRLRLTSNSKPDEFLVPRGVKFSQRMRGGQGGPKQWLLTDTLPELKITFGRVEVQAGSPGKLVLENIAIPGDSPIKLPWQAVSILDDLMGRQKRRKPSRSGRVEIPQQGERTAAPVQEGIPRFTSDVRLVNLTASVFDHKGRPVTELRPEDFEILEDGVTQDVTFAGAEEIPFNLALLLDLSGSTLRDREAMKEASLQFIGITRPHDRLAAYALANNIFHVVSPLTDDRNRLRKLIEGIPEVSGGTPLYDAIVLAYSEELRHHPEGRNALIVISDGVDNRIRGSGAASEVSFQKLRRAVADMNVSFYPVFLDSFTKIPPPDWALRARLHMQILADATGGRLFHARSIRDLDPVYPLVAEELRSVYIVAYYPKNQDFDGAWRQIQVLVNRPDVKIRTRAGYYAR